MNHTLASPPPAGIGSPIGMTPAQILILANLIHYNPLAWRNFLREQGNETRITGIDDLSGEKLLIHTTNGTTGRKWLLDLNTAQITDSSGA